MCVRKRECVSVSVCVCERERMCMNVCERVRERESVCTCVNVGHSSGARKGNLDS